MMSKILRTRIGRDIVCEVAVPARRSSRKVLILAGGMPSMPSKRTFLETFAKAGYWVFFPRYRGSWESGGVFLRKSPTQDILDVISAAERGFSDAATGERYKIEPNDIFLIGISFGGPAVLLASSDPRVSKVIALSPVVDWTAPSRAEPLGWLKGFLKRGFGEGYRFGAREWNKLSHGTFYNPVAHTDKVAGEKIWIMHAKDDAVVAWRSVERFAKLTGSTLSLYKRGGHLSSMRLLTETMLQRVNRFFRA